MDSGSSDSEASRLRLVGSFATEDTLKLRSRLRILLTRKTKWSWDGGPIEEHKESLSSAWAIARPYLLDFKPYRRWIFKRGALDCGCHRNPITRRIVLFALDCKEDHGGFRRHG